MLSPLFGSGLFATPHHNDMAHCQINFDSPQPNAARQASGRAMTLLENVDFSSETPTKSGFYGSPQDPESTGQRYPPPSIPQGTRHSERYPCTQQLRSIDREDELAPAATGILAAIAGEGGLLMMKIIRNVPISWYGHIVDIPLRIRWEIEALEKTGCLTSPLIHQWGYWVDPATVRGAGQLGSGPPASGTAIGEVYISIKKESGVTLREYQPYADMKSEDDRTQLLSKLKQVVARRIVQYAVEDGIFHGGLNLGNIHITPKTQLIRYRERKPVFEPTGDYEVQFSDWGWVRKVTSSNDVVDCSDPWLIPSAMVVPKNAQEPDIPFYVMQYVDAVFETAWKLKGRHQGGVNEWKHPW